MGKEFPDAPQNPIDEGIVIPVEVDKNKYYNLQCPDYSLLDVNNYD